MSQEFCEDCEAMFAFHLPLCGYCRYFIDDQNCSKGQTVRPTILHYPHFLDKGACNFYSCKNIQRNI